MLPFLEIKVIYHALTGENECKLFLFLAKFKAKVETQQMTIRAREVIIESQKTENSRLQECVDKLEGKSLLLF